MTNSRHDPDRTVLVRTFGVTFGVNRAHDFHKIVPPTAPGWDRLIYATRGMMTVHADESSWAVPPHRAIWIPDGLSCRIEMNGEVAVRILYLKTGIRRGQACGVVNVTLLLRELILRAVSLGALDSSIPVQRRLCGVIRDELKTLRAVSLQLPLPQDERALKFASLADSTLSVPELLRHCGAGKRTMERLFLDETAMSLGQWLRRQKLMRALRLLAANRSVKQVAGELGYANPSAFIAMFRRELGETPTRYFQ